MDPAKAMPSAYRVASNVDQSELGTSVMSIGSEKKKRGRPRKYKPDESSSRAFSSLHVSSAGSNAYAEEDKLTVRRPIGSEKRHKNDWIECSTGSSFLPHVITVDTGEDITTKIMEFSRQGPRAVCILSGSGTVSNVTIRHPGSSGGILTYEGIFEILSFSGSFTPTEMPDQKFGQSGMMMTITLSGADGRVVGGLIAGLTTAATPIKVVVASFLLSGPNELKPTNQFTMGPPIPSGSPVPKVHIRSSNGTQGPSSSIYQNPNNWAAMQSAGKPRKPNADVNMSLHG